MSLRASLGLHSQLRKQGRMVGMQSMQSQKHFAKTPNTHEGKLEPC